jgi:hypothetical protein
MIGRSRRGPDITEDKPLLGPIVYVPLLLILVAAAAIAVFVFI